MRLNKTLALVAAVAAAAVTLSSCASTAKTQNGDYTLVEAGTLTVCSDTPYRPFEFEDASTASGYSGLDMDLMAVIAEKMGLKLKVRDVEFDSLKSGAALAAGQCDMAASAMSITEERKANMDFGDPYFDSLQSLLVRKDSGITNLAGLANKKIGVQSGTTGKIYATANAPATAKLIDYGSDGELWPAIQAGQIDAILQDFPVNDEHQKADAKYVIVATYPTDEKYGFAFPKGKNSGLMAAVNAQLAAARADGSYDKIYAKYVH